MKKIEKTTLQILADEIKGDMKSALKKMDKNYTMTWVYKGPKNGELFPRSKASKEIDLKDVYVIKGRKYDIKNITSSSNVVMIEVVESYPDPKTKKVYRTPLVIVLEFKDGKIIRGRHYCDPNLSYMNLSTKQIKSIYK